MKRVSDRKMRRKLNKSAKFFQKFNKKFEHKQQERGRYAEQQREFHKLLGY